MRLTKKLAPIAGIAVAAGAFVAGISPAANAADGSGCGASPGNAYTVCISYSTGSGGGITASSTSDYSGGIDYHVQLVNPSGTTLCNSNTAVDNDGTTVSCTWHASSFASGNYCAINWQYVDGEYQQYGKFCIDA
jgi:hypothetical protein